MLNSRRVWLSNLKSMPLPVLLLVLLLVPAGTVVRSAAAAEPQLPAADETPDQSIAAGKVLFNTVGCWSCHGFNAQGATSRGIASGPRINARVLPEAAFVHQLRSPVSVMPPYTPSVLSDAQVTDIYNYLRSLPVPQPVEDIPLLKMP
jgi:mono/diheme cytochrome c family protein